MTFPLTVSMTPAFLLPGDNLFRAQLRCLSEQICKAFDVLVIDAHYNKRKSYMAELAEKYKLSITHVPYRPNQLVAKRLDCSIFNTPYLFSQSSKIVRYSCWRFVKPHFTLDCNNSNTNVDFRFHSCEPPDPKFIDSNSETGHDVRIWDGKSDQVNWDAVPKKSGDPGATWGPDSDVDAKSELFPRNCYGNYMVDRTDWLSINGVNEGPFSTAHFEDMDFVQRARNAGIKCSREAHEMYRLHHHYGSHSGRANIVPDHELKPNCPACEKACSVLEPNRFDLKRRHAAGEIEMLEQHQVWVCKTCFLCGPIYHADCGEYTGWLENSKTIQAAIIPKYKIGRNLRILAGDMDGKSLAQKVEIFNDSWSNDRYYRQ